MNGFDLSTISGLYVGSIPYSAIYKGSSKIWEAAPPYYSLEYFTIESLEDNNAIHIYSALGSGQPDSSSLGILAVWYYSTDKVNWTKFNVINSTQYYNTNFITLNKNQKVYLKTTSQFYKTGITNTNGNSTYQYNYFYTTKNFKAYGNIMSLCYGDNFVNQTTLPWTHTFYYLFRSCTTLVDISNLILPATTLTNYCYNNMFYSCTSLTTTPVLPATTLTNYCYSNMFNGCRSLTTTPVLPATTLNTGCYMQMFSSCTSLTVAPELPATTLNAACYMYMFNGCRSLTTAPSLPATTLKSQCYQNMFYGCTSLTTAPVLPATSLVNKCYQNMFYGCTLLNYVKALFTTDISSSTTYTENWLYNVAAIGTFIKGQGASWSRTDASGIPQGWTVKVDGAPEPNATIKIYNNYNQGTRAPYFNITNSSSTTENTNYSDPVKQNRKYTQITPFDGYYSISDTYVFDYVIEGFSQFYVELFTTQSSSGVIRTSLHPINGGTTKYGKGNYSQGLVYSTNTNGYGHYYSFDDLDPTKKYHVMIEIDINSFTMGVTINMPYIYPTPTITSGYFVNSQDWSDIYSS